MLKHMARIRKAEQPHHKDYGMAWMMVSILRGEFSAFDNDIILVFLSFLCKPFSLQI